MYCKCCPLSLFIERSRWILRLIFSIVRNVTNVTKVSSWFWWHKRCQRVVSPLRTEFKTFIRICKGSTLACNQSLQQQLGQQCIAALLDLIFILADTSWCYLTNTSWCYLRNTADATLEILAGKCNCQHHANRSWEYLEQNITKIFSLANVHWALYRRWNYFIPLQMFQMEIIFSNSTYAKQIIFVELDLQYVWY